MKNIFNLLTVAYRFRAAVKRCMKELPDSEDFQVGQFYKTEMKRLEKVNITIQAIDELIARTHADKEKYKTSDLITVMLDEFILFWEAMKPLVKCNQI
ncbi:MAG: hypothetical protein H6850_00655 [Alphaproteobacteria bacterium]|nr:MAG: hypothetical protein H6850_00655 [Alphaproteobacteria bacterium]